MTTEDDVARILRIRAESTLLVTIGACSNTGGIQALRNLADVNEFGALVYPQPQYVAILARLTPISAHVPVDVEIPGCPIDRGQLFGALTALLAGRGANLPVHSVCQECKLRGTTYLVVACGTPCLGPVIRAGYGALCPAYRRGCFGYFGPADQPNSTAMVASLRQHGLSARDTARIFRTFNVADPHFQDVPHGRGHLEPPDITARIWGICPVAYQISGCMAIENASGVRVPDAIAEVRRLI